MILPFVLCNNSSLRPQIRKLFWEQVINVLCLFSLNLILWNHTVINQNVGFVFEKYEVSNSSLMERKSVKILLKIQNLRNKYRESLTDFINFHKIYVVLSNPAMYLKWAMQTSCICLKVSHFLTNWRSACLSMCFFCTSENLWTQSILSLGLILFPLKSKGVLPLTPS